MQFPARPMETKTGLARRPGTVTLKTRIECGDDLIRAYVPPWPPGAPGIDDQPPRS